MLASTHPWRRSLLSLLGAAIIASFALNWLWEMTQMSAYTEMAGRSWRQTAWPCTVATLGDVAVTLAVYGVIALATGRLEWPTDGKWNAYAAAFVIGAACGVGIEWRALALGQWSYNDRMPTLPALGVGLWPLLQLAVLIPAALWLAGLWSKRS